MAYVVPAWPVAMNFIVATLSVILVSLHRHKLQVHYPTLRKTKNKKASYMPTHGIPYDLSSILFNCLKQSYWDIMYLQRTSPMGHYSVRDVYLHVCPS